MGETKGLMDRDGRLKSGVGSACTFEQILLPTYGPQNGPAPNVFFSFLFSGYLFYNLKFLVQEDSAVGVDLAF